MYKRLRCCVQKGRLTFSQSNKQKRYRFFQDFCSALASIEVKVIVCRLRSKRREMNQKKMMYNELFQEIGK